MQPNNLRKAFLDFFETKSHKILPSSPLVPQGDQTLLFANAGMNQFKDYFTGQSKPENKRATTSQKCVRAGGKHNDLENVGVTTRHHTFFEMLGNFSFGDYFKTDAITFAWEFLTEVCKIDDKRLWITIHDSDDEAGELWKKETGFPDEKIVKMGDKDNFWAMGDTGPCGPCSEIHYDQGINVGCQSKDCALGCECDRFLEIWNLVFMQYEQKADGSRSPLPNPCIDTGMGLERLSAVIIGKESNYDTELFTPLLEDVAKITGVAYSTSDTGTSHRILADHAKAATFLISDGIFPSNEGRGYVLRRIMRRAIRNAWLLGYKEPILNKLVDRVVSMYSEAYPELKANHEKISKMVNKEEKSFLKTIDKGIILFDRNKEAWEQDKTVPGAIAFKLYDTYGFPLDLTEQMAQQENMKVDTEGFNRCMEEQRTLARQSSMFKVGELEGLHWNVLNESQQLFSGYTETEKGSRIIKTTSTDKQTLLALEDSVFYGEAGGQVGDSGTVTIEGNSYSVENTQTIDGLRTLIINRPEIGSLDSSTIVSQIVDTENRQKIRANHSCTHLLHQVLKEVLGDHAEQRGSWVGTTHLRFDFPHHEGVSKGELSEIEKRVNSLIQSNFEITTKVSSLDDAKEAGVTALFGEKYGSQVRIVKMGAKSNELCGGTHLHSTGEAMAFVITSESSIASGIRRIEAITGENAIQHLFKQQQYVKKATALLQTKADEIELKIKQLQSDNQNLKKEMSALKLSGTMSVINEKLMNPLSVNNINYLAEIIDNADANDLRKTAENIKSQNIDFPFILAGSSEGKASLILSYPNAWVKEKNMNAGKDLKGLAKHIQGGGGGSPSLAQAGGQNPDGFANVLEDFKSILRSM